MMNSWEKAVTVITKPDEHDPEIKARQREINQKDWDEALQNVPNESSTFDNLVKQRQDKINEENNDTIFGYTNQSEYELKKIYNLVKHTGSRIEGEPLHVTVEKIIDLNNRLAVQLEKVKKAMTIL